MTSEAGMRVLRGPHWQGGDADGGEGHLGTLTALLGNGHVQVLWDNGTESTCRAGADGKYELRILDTGQVGVRHKGSRCVECDESDVYGMLWRCVETSCRDVTLCSLCYVMDKHNLKHPFERVDTEGSAGERVKKRSVSLRMRTMGIFPGATVTRGRDWFWGDQDGGPGSTGEVMGYENVAPNSTRNLVRVQWGQGGVSNSYRVGLGGNVDLQCVEETAGIYYYRDHLPLVDTVGSVRPSSQLQATTNSSTSLSSSSSSSSQSSPRDSSQRGGATGRATGGATGGAGSELGAGDMVVIGVSEERLKELQADYGGATAGMIQCIGKQGEVVSVTSRGALQVKFDRLSYRLNPSVLTKVNTLSEGDVVRICPDLHRAKVLNKHVGWKPEMDVTCGRVGKVVKVDEDGDAAVAFGRKVHLYAPACCLMAPGFQPDELTSSSGSNSSGSDATSGTTGGEDLHQKMMRVLAQVAQKDDTGSNRDDGSEMSQLFYAINRGDAEAVQAVCMADTELLKQTHKGMTLMMVACHEGQRDVINTLLDLGADLDQQGDQGNTALGAALEGKKQSIALLLLERGAGVNAVNSKQRTMVHLAAYNDLGEALRQIISKGADVNRTDKYGDSPLHDAIEKNNDDAIDALMEAPSLDLQVRNRKGFNMLQLASLRGNLHAVERILARDRSHIDDLMGGQFNALHIAVANDNVECARVLIVEGKAALNVKGSQGLTALHLACNEAYPRCVELLLAYGADVHVVANDGNTPLHLAVGTKSTQLNKNPSEALEKYEHRHRVQIANMLLEKGAFLDATNNNGAEPLQCCRPDYIRNGVKHFIKENPSLIKRQGGGGGGGGGGGDPDLQAALQALLQGSGASERQLQEQCKQS
ncbi:E3 ubiquitin-protein ligase MIB2-like [Littorina saxatilis]|uniref:RING-type E3 ubiquitin transferase n=1 Tax=Littorina saxatilis TaxID=31220 RepID=A0AAN9G434_9CAEN